jgi:hypothetical protein
MKTNTGMTASQTSAAALSAFCLLLCAFAIFFSGCAGVPATEIRFDPKKDALIIKSPKDIELRDVLLVAFPATATNAARFELTIGSYISKNNLEVIRAITEANNANLQRAAEIGGALLGTAIDAAK